MMYISVNFRPLVTLGCVILFAGSLGHAPLHAATEPSTNDVVTAPSDDVDWARHVVEAYKDFSEQQLEAVAALEQTRRDAAAAAAAATDSAERMEARMKQLQATLLADRERQIQALEDSHRFTLKVVSLFAITGFLGMLVVALFLMRVMSRRMRVATSTALAHRPLDALGTGDQALVSLDPAEESSARFLTAIERLEKRIAEMEQEAVAPEPAGAGRPGDIIAEPVAAVTPASATAEPSPEQNHVAVLLGKGQTHLNLGQFDEALACFDEAIALDPANADAHVRKGSALEGKDQIDEAMAQYDRAIALDQTMTTAYLRKGGVYNRLERYGEALQCYEQALRTQQRPQVQPMNS